MEILIIAGCLVLVAVGLPAAAIAYVAARQAWRCVRLYVVTLAAALGIPDPSTATLAQPRDRSAPGQEPAFEHYLRRQAWLDLSAARTTALAAGRAEFRREWNRVQDRRLGEPWRFPAGPRRLVLRAGLVPGTAVAVILLAVTCVAQAAVGIVLILLGLIMIGALRAVEAAIMHGRRITAHCPTCFRPVSYPSYRCPGCRARHQRISPGYYGLLHRRCGCGRMSLPVPLLLGSHGMAAHCADPGCGVRLPGKAGAIPEVVLPVLGGPRAGRTRLVTALVTTLRDSTERSALALTPADQVTAARVADLAQDVAGGAPTLSTPPGPARAYSFYLTGPARRRRLLHVLDTGGTVSLDDHTDPRLYLRLADTFLFVIDPLAIGPVWAALGPERQAELAALRGGRPPKDEFDAVTQKSQEMGASLHTSRLAAVVAKADLLAGTDLDGLPDGEAIERWLEDMGQDHLTRCMRHLFGEVRFFTAAATADGDSATGALPSLARWLLAEPDWGRRTASSRR